MNRSYRTVSRKSRLSEKDIRFAILAAGLLPGSLTVLYPPHIMKSMGLYFGPQLGFFPSASSHGQGKLYCRRFREPVLLQTGPEDKEQAQDFDRLSEMYEALVGISSIPVIQESIKLIELMAIPSSRVLDLSCGPGTEIPALCKLVPEGEVVGVDLSSGMVAAAFGNARSKGISNAAFIQADALHLPDYFEATFDLIFCCNSFHHYPDPLAALKEMRRSLSADGKVLIVDPRLSQFFLMTEPIAKWGDPGYVGFYSAEELHRLFMTAGYAEFYWNEMLPMVGLSIGTK